MDDHPDTLAAWTQELTARARAHWTPERTLALTHGKALEVLPGKYLQANHLVRLLRPAVEELAGRHPVVQLLDAGCGRSYLTLLLAWCARERWGCRVEVLGVDRSPALIAECQRRAAAAGLTDVVSFLASPLEALPPRELHGVFALHACDTATCDAIALGVGARAELIAVAPCCHAELARKWATLAGQPGAFAPVWRTPHLRRETAVQVTDTPKGGGPRGARRVPGAGGGHRRARPGARGPPGVRGVRPWPGPPAARGPRPGWPPPGRPPPPPGPGPR